MALMMPGVAAGADGLRFEVGTRGLTLIAPHGTRAGYVLHIPQFSMGLSVAPESAIAPFVRAMVGGLTLPGPAGTFEVGAGLEVTRDRRTFRLHGGLVAHFAAIFFVVDIALPGQYVGVDVLVPVYDRVRVGFRIQGEFFPGPHFPSYDPTPPAPDLPTLLGVTGGLLIEFD